MRQRQSGEVNLAPASNAVVAVASATRAAVAALAGLGFTCAVAAVIWAITPASGASPVQLLRGGVAAYALAHFAPVTIGPALMTLSPMFMTLLFSAMLIGSIGRGSSVPRTATEELIGIAIGTLTYAVVVGLLVGWLATSGSVSPLVGVCAGGVALVSLTVGTIIRGEALRQLLVSLMPEWCVVAVRAAVVAALIVFGGAALALAGSLAVSFGTAATLTDATTSGLSDQIGLTLAGIAYLPNAIAAAVGYVTGVGFDIGQANYSPFGSVQADLPPLPLLAAVPADSVWSGVGLLMLLIPVLAGVGAAVAVTRGVPTRRERLYAIAVASGAAALVVALLVGVAGGGIEGGEWSVIGAPALTVALVVLLAVLVAGGTWTAAAGGTNVAWKPEALAVEPELEAVAEPLEPEVAEPEVAEPEAVEPEVVKPDKDAVSEAEAEAEVDLDADPDSEVELDAEAEPELDPETEPDAEPELNAEPEPDVEAEVELPEAEPDGETEVEPSEVETESETEIAQEQPEQARKSRKSTPESSNPAKLTNLK